MHWHVHAGRTDTVIELVHVGLEAVVVLGRVGAVGAGVEQRLGMGFLVRAEHGQVNTRVVALRAFKGFGAHVIAHVVL